MISACSNRISQLIGEKKKETKNLFSYITATALCTVCHVQCILVYYMRVNYVTISINKLDGIKR